MFFQKKQKKYFSRTLGDAVSKLLRFLQDMLSMIPTKFCEDVSNCL